jgi:hypothetical protein
MAQTSIFTLGFISFVLLQRKGYFEFFLHGTLSTDALLMVMMLSSHNQ